MILIDIYLNLHNKCQRTEINCICFTYMVNIIVDWWKQQIVQSNGRHLVNEHN